MSPADELKEQLEQFVKRVTEFWESCRGDEASTGSALILPLFEHLGYDQNNPHECKPQYKADFGEYRSKEPVDWAFFASNSLAFLVEAKAVGEKIGRSDQLRDYYAQERGAVKLGILTNGVRWRFFTDSLVAENIMDSEPFLEWDVLKDTTIPHEFLTKLQRTGFKPELIKSFAKQRYRQRILVAGLSAALKPSTEFVRFLLTKKLEPRNLNKAVLDEWTPIFVRAITEWAHTKRDDDLPPDEDPPPERYIEFWGPIQREGLFKGKPANRRWIAKWKGLRGICLSLVVLDHLCRVEVEFPDENAREQRDRALKLLPAGKYPRELHESPKCVSVRFSVLDKGIKDRDNWPEIRDKLKSLGEQIYKVLEDSDV